MAMVNRKVLLFVLCLAVCAGKHLCRGHDTSNDLREKAEEVKQGAGGVLNDAEEKAESWGGWAYDKFTDGIGIKEEKNIEDLSRDSVGDAASGATDAMKSAASGAWDYASQKSSDVADAARETAKNTMTEEDKAKYEATKEKASQAMGDLGSKMRQATGST